MERLLVSDLIGRPWGVISADAVAVCRAVSGALRAGHRLEVSFAGMELVTTAFLKGAIGRMYAEFEAGWLERQLLVSGLEDPGAEGQLERVTRRASEYYAGAAEATMPA